MPTFKAPVYVKKPNAKGQLEPSYSFAVEFSSSEEILSFVAEAASDISLSSLQRCVLEKVEWWNTVLRAFLTSSAKLFSKPYTVDHIHKITKHTLHGTASVDYPVNVSLLPTLIEIMGGVFLVHWKYVCEPIVIDMMPIPDFDSPVEAVPVLNEIVEGVEECTLDSVPMDGNPTEALELDNPVRSYERQKVKEARLKAKLAMYKAQNEITRYYEKYGDDDITDSDSESEYTEGGDSDAEEVQL